MGEFEERPQMEGGGAQPSPCSQHLWETLSSEVFNFQKYSYHQKVSF